jgi:hypothetical protein
VENKVYITAYKRWSGHRAWTTPGAARFPIREVIMNFTGAGAAVIEFWNIGHAERLFIV